MKAWERAIESDKTAENLIAFAWNGAEVEEGYKRGWDAAIEAAKATIGKNKFFFYLDRGICRDLLDRLKSNAEEGQ